MNNPAAPSNAVRQDLLGLLARCLLGGVMLYLGFHKALHPVDFLKLLRQYELTENPFFLNLVAATLPWFEIFCGLLLLSGLAVRGAASLSLLMLIPFSIVVLLRALRLHDANGLPFCAIRFDCGCGGGEVVICHKLAENTLLILTAALLLIVPARRWCLRRDLLRNRG